MKKRLGIIAGILGIVLAVIGIVLKQKENTAVSVIGGADGPTSIFIAGKLNVDNFIFMIVVGIILLIVGFGGHHEKRYKYSFYAGRKKEDL